MALEIGKHHSWTVISDNIVEKHCTESAFGYGLTEIVTDIWEFWDIYSRTPKRHWFLNLNFRGVREQVRIEVQELGHGRLYFSPEMKKWLKDYNYLEHDVTFTFTKVGYGEYDVTAKVEKTSLDGDDPFETVVEEEDENGRAEGKARKYYTTTYERIPKYREAAIRENKGYTCKCCGFDFVKKYGEVGKNFIEVHHVVPLASRTERIVPDVKNDLVCLCPNCHRMIHRKKGGGVYKLPELQKIIMKAEKKAAKV